MKTSVILLAVFGGLTASSPLVAPRDMSICNAIQQRQCCDFDVDGILDGNCESPSSTPKDMKDFSEICSKTGKAAACCILSVVGEGLVCGRP
ncbi:uncharacterized protein PAC_10741 [Phialocephala subalpina]|uniref:Uncharacterized protein n=1 Tax=Phialocephala subalpina TaxID=576137 RepID=A0A1L7X744_9HELO|nr:uncharacterized protein PAC_10741 [Phialocephala subalpina]